MGGQQGEIDEIQESERESANKWSFYSGKYLEESVSRLRRFADQIPPQRMQRLCMMVDPPNFKC
jgi:hypothetical protein